MNEDQIKVLAFALLFFIFAIGFIFGASLMAMLQVLGR